MCGKHMLASKRLRAKHSDLTSPVQNAVMMINVMMVDINMYSFTVIGPTCFSS